MKFAVALATVGFGVALIASPGQASVWSNAVESCQGSLPSFEGALRKRPLGISNEGSSTSFVTCSMAADLDSPSGVTIVAVLLTNRTSAAVNINCTLVSGIAPPFGAPVYITKVIPIGPNSANSAQWDSTADNAGNDFVLANLNCAVPPGVELNVVQTTFTAS